MTFVRILPPGSLLMRAAIKDLVYSYTKNVSQKFNFLEIGCGDGSLSKMLLDDFNSVGVGLDYSSEAIQETANSCNKYIAGSKYLLTQSHFNDYQATTSFDIILCCMVLEHVENEGRFIRRCYELLKKGGILIITVPAHMKYWSQEDELVGHFRRYNREDLDNLLQDYKFSEIEVKSIQAPISNILFKVGKYLISKSSETSKTLLSLEEQTKLSGLQYVKWKTVFPFWIKVLMNDITIRPFHYLQKIFYKTNYGLVYMAVAKK